MNPHNAWPQDGICGHIGNIVSQNSESVRLRSLVIERDTRQDVVEVLDMIEYLAHAALREDNVASFQRRPSGHRCARTHPNAGLREQLEMLAD